MNNQYKKIIGLTLVAFFMLVSGSPVYAVTKGNDEVYIASPINNAVVTGISQVRYFLKEADKADIPYQIDLFSSACSVNGPYFGTIASGSKTASANGAYFTDLWDTDGPIQNRSSIPDGFYCVRICATFRELPNNFYSLCDKHTVAVGNTNRPPVINSQPPNSSIKVGEDFTYQVQATDPDGHKLTYVIDKGGDFFLYMNRDTGLIYTEKTITTAGSYPITITVSDGFGGVVKQFFTLNVTEPDLPPAAINFVVPGKDTVITKNNNKLSWNIERFNPTSILLSYSKDEGKNWVQIANLNGSTTSYDWNLQGVETGKYLLRIIATNNEGKTIEKISELFDVTISTSDTGEEAPLITIISPQEEERTLLKKPIITVTIKPSTNAELLQEGIEVLLDEEKLTVCDFADEKLECQPAEDLADGRHKIQIRVTDSAGKFSVRELFFYTGESEPDSFPDSMPDSNPDSYPANIFSFLGAELTRVILLILCCGLLLIVVPWMLYILLIRNRRSSSDIATDYGSVTYTDNSQPLVPNPDIPYSETTIVMPDQTTTYATPEVYEPSIGTQTIGEYEDPFISKQEPVQEMKVAAPAIYNDDEIPDWLKNTDSASDSKPVVPQGSSLDYDNKTAESANPYGSYGIASQNENQE